LPLVCQLVVASPLCCTAASSCPLNSLPLPYNAPPPLASCLPACFHVTSHRAISTSCHLLLRHHLTCPSSTPYLHLHWQVVVLHLAALPLPPVISSTPPPYITPATPPPVCLLFAPTGCSIASSGTSASHPPAHPPLHLCLLLVLFLLPWLIIMLSPINLQLCNCHLPSIASPANGWLLRLPPTQSSPTRFCLPPHCRASCDH
jgi:hypothetical protein